MTDLKQSLVTKGKVDPGIAERLVESGISKDDLEADLGGETKEEKELRRMNFVGSLRALGFQVLGGRVGTRGHYQVIGWEEKKEAPGIPAWDEESKARIADIHKLSPVTRSSWQDLYSHQGTKQSEERRWLHENSAMEVLCYEVGGYSSRGFFYDFPSGNRTVVVQKFRDRPVFKIVNLDATALELTHLAQYLGPVSYKPVQIVNIDQGMTVLLKQAFPKGYAEKHAEAICETKKLAFDDELWNSRGRGSKAKVAGRTTEIYRVEDADALQQTVIEEWRKEGEKRQRQLSIVRDYEAVLCKAPTKITFLGIRDGVPVSLHIVDRLVGLESEVVGQVVEKSLNYRTQQGGRPGTSDFNLRETSRLLYELGIEWLNLGHIDGGTQGLADRKRALLSEVVYLWNFRTDVFRPS